MPDAIPAFATAAPAAILTSMPTLEKNATQPGLIAPSGKVLETTRRLAVMNLALRGIEADFGPEHADTFSRDLHPDLRTDTATRVRANPQPRSHLAGRLRSERQLLANPPFNDSDTALRGSAFLQTGGRLQVMPERHDNFRKDDDVGWRPSGARSTAKGSPQGERGGVHQFGVPPRTKLRVACDD